MCFKIIIISFIWKLIVLRSTFFKNLIKLCISFYNFVTFRKEKTSVF